jgi:predicted DCC family thiol-disulfide oxidoreductase YuxK
MLNYSAANQWTVSKWTANQWTGGQYSLLRIVCGVWMLAHFSSLSARIFPSAESGLLLIALGLTVLIITGLYDRIAAFLLAGMLFYLQVFTPLGQDRNLPYLVLIGLLLAQQQPAPYGSLQRVREIDPGTGWQMPRWLYVQLWLLMAFDLASSGWLRLSNLLDGVDHGITAANRGTMWAAWAACAIELSFPLLALVRPLRLWAWLTVIALRPLLLGLSAPADFSMAQWLMHLMFFDPAWIRPVMTHHPETVFYDGHCGLCHGAVRFLLAEDSDGSRFRFAPLDSDLFLRTVPEHLRRDLPDSLIVLTEQGRLLTRSAAVLHLLHRLGGAWRLLAMIMSPVPQRLRDAAYDAIARVRHRLFPAPEAACPMLPPALRRRFLF